VRRLVLVDAATHREARALASTRYLSLLRPFFYAWAYQSRSMRRRGLAVLYYDPARVADDVVDHYMAMARFRGHQEALSRLASAVSRDRPLRLDTLRVPVLILWGEQDRLVGRSRGRWLQAHLPDARLMSVPEAGHMLPEEQPDVFNRVVAEFASAGRAEARAARA
jgi:pimeloyl-ACP methyl ester carboxylesterase